MFLCEYHKFQKPRCKSRGFLFYGLIILIPVSQCGLVEICAQVGVLSNASISVRYGHSRHAFCSPAKSLQCRSSELPILCPDNCAPSLHDDGRNPQYLRSPFACQLFMVIACPTFLRIQTTARSREVSNRFQSQSSGKLFTSSGGHSSSMQKNFLHSFIAFLCSMLILFIFLLLANAENLLDHRHKREDVEREAYAFVCFGEVHVKPSAVRSTISISEN